MNDDEGTDPLVTAIERLLVGGIGLTALALSETPAAFELTLGQWRVLVIGCERDDVRIGELASRLGIAVPSASRLVRRLERKRLLTAVRDERDRRATVVKPTDEGRRVRAAVMERRRDLIEAAIAGARPDAPEETAARIDRIADALAPFA